MPELQNGERLKYGHGCRWCEEGVPVAERICESCWGLRFGWPWGAIQKWLGRQADAFVKNNARKAALRLWGRHKIAQGIIEYAETYGAWLVPEADLSRGIA